MFEHVYFLLAKHTQSKRIQVSCGRQNIEHQLCWGVSRWCFFFIVETCAKSPLIAFDLHTTVALGIQQALALDLHH